MDLIEPSRTGDVVTLTLTAPTMTPPFFAACERAFTEVAADATARAVVVRSSAPSFSFGLDLPAAMAAWGPVVAGGGLAGNRTALLGLIRQLQRSFTAIAACPMPVIAAIHGKCIGGGVDLISACDLRVGSADAVFSVRETKVALVADLGSLQRLPALIGAAATRELALTGKDIDAAAPARGACSTTSSPIAPRRGPPPRRWPRRSQPTRRWSCAGSSRCSTTRRARASPTGSSTWRRGTARSWRRRIWARRWRRSRPSGRRRSAASSRAPSPPGPPLAWRRRSWHVSPVEFARQVTARYVDPLAEVWLAAAAKLGLRVERRPDAYAATDGRGALIIGTDATLDADDSVAQMIFHELCHALVQGEGAFTQPDWGLDNQTTQHAWREHATLRLQRTLAARHGLTRMFAPTTDYRMFWDALPADPLADRADPTVIAATAALGRADRAPWAPILTAALTATAAIVSATAPQARTSAR